MDKTIREKWEMLPAQLKAISVGDSFTNGIVEVWTKFLEEDLEKLEDLKNLIGLLLIGEMKLSQIKNVLEKHFAFDENKSREANLLMLTGILYQAKNYFPGIEDEIRRLGGEVPQDMPPVVKNDDQFLNREEEIAEMQAAEEEEAQRAVQEKPVWGGIKELLQQFPAVGEQIIGTQDSINVKNYPVPMKPMIRYWLEDYLQKNNYAQKSNLERIQYVCHDLNTRKMNTEERRQLMVVLKSADGELSLPLLPMRSRIDFSLLGEEE